MRPPQLKPPGVVRLVRVTAAMKEERVNTTTATQAARPWYTATPGEMVLHNATRHVPAAVDEGVQAP
jgi:hypothetical protein